MNVVEDCKECRWDIYSCFFYWLISSLSYPTSCGFELDGELILHGTLPCSPLYCSDYQVIIANDFGIESAKGSHQDILFDDWI